MYDFMLEKEGRKIRDRAIDFVKHHLRKKEPENYISLLQSRGILTSYNRGKLSFTG